MAIDAATIWEFRATNGSNNNGGGYANLNPGTSVDYSNQDAAQFNPTDLAQAQSSTTLTSATGGFTAAMEGNVIHITAGTNFDAGWYQITGYTDTNTVTIDRTAASGGAGSGGTGYVGGAMALFTDAFLDDTNVIVAGNTIWVKNDGTMTLTGAIAIANTSGSDTAQITIEGYNSSRGDNPTGTNRPLIACGENAFGWSGVNNWRLQHLRFTTTEAAGVAFQCQYSYIINCASNNSSGTAGRAAFKTGASATTIGIDAQSANGDALYSSGSYSRHIGGYFHDSVDGIDLDGITSYVFNCVFDTCTGNGLDVAVRDYWLVINCTFYNCGTAINGSSGTHFVGINNIFDACTDGAKWSSDYSSSHFFDYNCWDCSTDVTNVTKGDNAVNGDPSMTDPANGNFSIPYNSNCVDAALDAGDLTDATV